MNDAERIRRLYLAQLEVLGRLESGIQSVDEVESLKTLMAIILDGLDFMSGSPLVRLANACRAAHVNLGDLILIGDDVKNALSSSNVTADIISKMKGEQ